MERQHDTVTSNPGSSDRDEWFSSEEVFISNFPGMSSGIDQEIDQDYEESYGEDYGEELDKKKIVSSTKKKNPKRRGTEDRFLPKFLTKNSETNKDKFITLAIIGMIIAAGSGLLFYSILKINTAQQNFEEGSVVIPSKQTIEDKTLHPEIQNAVLAYLESTKTRKEKLEDLEDTFVVRYQQDLNKTLTEMISDRDNPLFRKRFPAALNSSSRENVRTLIRVANGSITDARLVLVSENGTETHLDVPKNLLSLFLIVKQKGLNASEIEASFPEFKTLKDPYRVKADINGVYYSLNESKESWEDSLDSLIEAVKQVEGYASLEDFSEVNLRHSIDNSLIDEGVSPGLKNIEKQLNENE